MTTVAGYIVVGSVSSVLWFQGGILSGSCLHDGHGTLSDFLWSFSGPGCTKQREISANFLQPLPLFWRIFLHGITDSPAEDEAGY